MSLTFYTNPKSRGRMVRWALEEVGERYETKVIAYGEEMKSPEYLAVNPMGKVPALVHDGLVVTETPAIIAYLADAFPAAGLAPAPGSKLRGAYYRWLFFAAGCIEGAMTNTSLGLAVPPEQGVFVGYGNLDLVLDVLEAAVSKSDYILGAAFSAADIYVGSQIGLGLMFGAFAPRPAFAAYTGRLTSRPAALRAAEKDSVAG